MCKKLTFAEVRPDLAKYYKPNLNGGKFMNEWKLRSREKVVLCCDNCERIKKTVPWTYCRITDKGNFNATFKCNYCNSLGVKFPHMIKEWHEKNEKTPFEIFPFSQKKFWWKCEKGHDWEAKVAHRTYINTYCPKCNLSRGEVIISKWLNNNSIEFESQYHVRLNNKSRRFDFYIPDEKIFVEVHGIQHFEDASSCKSFYAKTLKNQEETDKQKREYAEANGKYIMVDYREHEPKLALERFIDALSELP